MSKTPSSRRTAVALAVLAGAVAAIAAIAGCDTPRRPTGDRPSAEFLLSAGDSTYWISSDAGRVRVRSSAMFLARYDDRIYEVYAADDDRSYYDAVFTSQRIYRRDLVDGDSVRVFDDAVVPALARRYATTHPHEAPLGPEEETAEQPRNSATTEVSLVDVHGPYLTYDARADIDVDGGDTRHALRRNVVDLRTARRASLVDLFGADAAASLVVEGRRRLGRALDSVRAIADTEDEAGARALHALPSFRFVPDNFGLATEGAGPAVVFVALGRDVDGHSVTLPIPAVPVPGAPPAWWDRDVRVVLPSVTADSSESRWRIGATEIVARRVAGQEAAALVLRTAAGHRAEWPLAQVPLPVHQLYRLDRPRIDGTTRRALTRAFNESALYGDDVISAAWNPQRTSARAHERRRGTAAPRALVRSRARALGGR